jgi:general stress protein 26
MIREPNYPVAINSRSAAHCAPPKLPSLTQRRPFLSYLPALARFDYENADFGIAGRTVGISLSGFARSSNVTSKVADNKKIGEIIGSIQVGMLTTLQANGELRSWPMLCFCQPRKRYASVSGLAQLVEDEKVIQKLWRPELKSYFPKGLEEPDLALLRVDIHHTEAWDGDTTG